MSLTIEPKQGIRLNLSSYPKIRSYQGGGEFWAHENQQVVMQYLGEFLPRAIENEGGKNGTVLFTHLINGKDVLSQSTALGTNGQQAPAEQLNRLRDAIARLKAKESDPLIDPNARKLIQTFRLPDPQKDPELYRIASGSTRRLLVLWGVEKESNSALMPQAAVARLPVAGGVSAWLVRLLWLLLILLLLGLGWWLWKGRQERAASTTGAGAESAIVLTEPQSSSPPAFDRSRIRHPKGAALGPRSRAVTHRRRGNLPPPQIGESTQSPASIRQVLQPRRLPPLSVRRILAPPPRRPTLPCRVHRVQPPLIPSRRRRHQNLCRRMWIDRIRNTEGQPLPPGSSAPPGEESPATDRTSKTPPPPQPETLPVPVATALPDNMKLEITNSRTSAEPRNGKVEVVLTAVGRDTNGEPVTVNAVKRWTIDGKKQKDAAGKAVTSTALPISLTKGTHKVAVEGTDRSGKPVRAEADVEVGIQVTEKTDVKVRPRE